MKKCIVLDLDNTLWGGVIGEDGMDGLALSLSGPGAAFVAFQQALRDLHDRGVILAINSRNNLDDALNVIRNHPCMILQEKHFAAMQINWDDKVQNLREIAEELNIGLDSMVFFDDDEFNRVNVRAFLPEVEAPDLPDNPSQYVKFLHSLPYFESNSMTDEDKMRGNFYVTERLRKEAEKQFANRDDFLHSLNIELRFFKDDYDDVGILARLSQLTVKTNQFNVRKCPLIEGEIRAFMESRIYSVFYARAIDKFGDQGIIVFALVRKTKEEWRIESFLMSCRVIGRGIEDAFLAEIAVRTALFGASKLSIAFEPSEKNRPARDFVERVFEHSINISPYVITRPNWISVI